MDQTDGQVIPLTAAQKHLQNAVAKELWIWREELHRRADQWYPEDVFPPAPKGEPHRTVDAAAAAMARHMLRLVGQDIGARSIELTHDDPGNYQPERLDVLREAVRQAELHQRGPAVDETITLRREHWTRIRELVAEN